MADDTDRRRGVSAVIDAHVSTRDQEREGFSIPAQQKLLREYASQHGLAVASLAASRSLPRLDSTSTPSLRRRRPRLPEAQRLQHRRLLLPAFCYTAATSHLRPFTSPFPLSA